MFHDALFLDQLIADRQAELTATATRVGVSRRARRARRTAAAQVSGSTPANQARRPPTTPVDELVTWANGVAALVADRGIGELEPLVRRVVEHARRRQVSAVLVDVLADRRQPAVARERALGAIVVALAAAPAPRRASRAA